MMRNITFTTWAKTEIRFRLPRFYKRLHPNIGTYRQRVPPPIVFMFFFTICHVHTASAQSSILYTMIVGDTAVLSVTGTTGSIQWQESKDSINWSNISGATNNPQTYITDTSYSGKRFLRAKMSDTAKCLLAPFYSTTIQHKVYDSIHLVQIGDWFRGGIVFYKSSATHGLIAPTSDQSSSCQWGCYGTSISGATSTSNGKANTAAIVAGCSTRPIAASICNSLTLNGYTDWYLPAKNELNYLYQKKNLVGGFSNSYYWSSSESNAHTAWLQYFNDGYQLTNNKGSGYYVRCIRSY